jgi:hypothetical protein
MRADEFFYVLLWVICPPIALGIALLRLVSVRMISFSKHRFWSAVIILVAIATLVALAFVVSPPSWAGRHLGIHDIHVLGIDTMWAPFSFVAVVVALPFSLWWVTRNGSKRGM